MTFKSSYILVGLTIALSSPNLIGIHPGWGQHPGDDDIEMLDIIEVPGTAVTREPRKLSFPSPDITNLLPLPDNDLFHVPAEFNIERTVPSPKVILDPKGNAQGIRSSVKPIKAERPPYPRFAREQGWHGTTVLRIKVETDGNVSSVTTQKSSGFPILDESASRSVKQWVFAPAKNGEFAVASTVDLPIRFDLDQPSYSESK